MDRLLAALQIDDGKAAHTQADWAIEIEAVVIRAAMPDCRVHAAHQFLVNVVTVSSNYSCDSTHLV